MILAWDPGDVRTGFAMFKYMEETKTADLLSLEILNTSQVYDMLELAEKMLGDGKQHTFVIEDFKADVMGIKSGRGRSQAAMFQWNQMLTSQLIGTIKYAAHRMNRSPVILQESSILATGRVWCDFKLPKGHIPDDKSAYIHGAHYMMKNRMIDTVDDIIKHGQGRLA